MLNPEQLKPYLLHEDQAVRDAVAEYFEDAWAQDESLVPLILQACDRFGEQENLRGLSACHRFPMTEQAFLDLAARLSRSVDLAARYHLNRAIAAGPLELLARHERVIAETPLSETTATQIRRRREFAGWSGPRLWEELQAFARGAEKQQNASEIDHPYVDALIEALAADDLPDSETLCDLLRSEKVQDSWLEIFLVDLAGERRARETIPILADKFRRDADYLPERCSEALARMGDPQSVHLIRSAFPAQEWSYRLFTSGLFGKIKVPDSAEAILSLLESEKDTTIRTNLCFSLCKLFSPRGVEAVVKEIDKGYDTGLVELEEELLPVIDILGIDLPEAARWRRKRKQRERLQAQRLRELDEMDRRYAALKEKGIDPFAKLGLPPPQPEAEPAQVTTYRRHDAKVGRNDPCPCGSGKKYKKCCEGK